MLSKFTPAFIVKHLELLIQAELVQICTMGSVKEKHL